MKFIFTYARDPGVILVGTNAVDVTQEELEGINILLAKHIEKHQEINLIAN